jgi:hypothetical protein
VNEKERKFGGFKIRALTLFVDQIDRARDKRVSHGLTFAKPSPLNVTPSSVATP